LVSAPAPTTSPVAVASERAPAIAADGSIVAVSDLGVFRFSPAGMLLAFHQPAGPCSPNPATQLCSYGFRSSPAIGPDGTIYVARPGIELLALSPDGAVVWSLPASSGAPATTVALHAGNLYGGTDGGHVVAVTPSGLPLFDTVVGTGPVRDVLMAGTKIMAFSEGPGASVTALSVAGGVVWTQPMETAGAASYPAEPNVTAPEGSLLLLTTGTSGGAPSPSWGALRLDIVTGVFISGAGGGVATLLSPPAYDVAGSAYFGVAEGLVGVGLGGQLGGGVTLTGASSAPTSPIAIDGKGTLVFARGSTINFVAP
jgi:hypothetical protein